MSHVQILHNPRCSKSRQTLSLLQENGIDAAIIEYLKNPPSEDELRAIAKKLGIDDPSAMMRTKEDEFEALGLNSDTVTPDILFTAMATTPKLIERPIVINGDKAQIGRPPEAVLDIL